jgi:hypothetical protein
MAGQDVSVGIGADNSQLLRVLQESKSAMSQFFNTVTEEGQGLGATLEEIQGKFASAFNFAGLTVGLEVIKQVGEAFERMGQEAAQLRTVAEVIGVTTDELQVMRQAAEESGVGADQLTHAGERLVSMLTEARSGSGDAVEKLLKLGVSTEQVNDPTFKLSSLLQILHDRLLDTATAESTMNDLMLVLGNRAALAAEAIKKYDGSAEHVKEVMAEINGLSSQQIDQMQEQGARWNDFSEKVENTTKKLVLNVAALGQWLQAHNATMKAMGDAVGAPKVESTGGASPVSTALAVAQQQAREIGELAVSLAREQEDANKKAQLEELEGIKQSVAAYREGSTQKLEALQREHALAQQIYGSDQIDKVKAIYQQIIAEERAVYDAGLQADQEGIAREDRHVQGVLRGYQAQIEANQRYFDEAEQNQHKLDQLTEFSEDLQTRLLKERSQLLQQQRALDQRVANEWYEKWSGVSGAIQSSFSGAISGMLRGTMTFSDAVRSIFSSVIDSLIQMFVKMGIQWAMGLLYQQVAQKATAIGAITANSGIAATAAMASVAAIPFYGWAMAPEVGATTFAEGMAYLASASAAGGYDIPAGQNPVTQLHAREMVLPAALADGVRNMTAGGSGRGGTVHIHGKPSDSVTVDQVVSMMKSAGHRFKFA